ncbi:phage repressor protein CI [Vibrio lentus]|nr:phage repressor protein CI [Vibrio lentus]PMI54301.1 transcriptional regulator [Vibrio lentus]
MSQDKIKPFDYMKGAEFTHNLKNLTNCKDFFELSELLNVPKSTFSTWNTHDRTSHELMVRLSLALNIPLDQLALKPENRHLSNSRENSNTISSYKANNQQPDVEKNPQHQTVILKSFCLSGGKLLDTGEIPYPLRRINSFGLQSADLIELETNEAIMLVDKNDNDAVSGSYLISIDGRHSINEVQRLPGKLLVEFNGTTIETQDGDIEVVGKVVTETRKR